MTDTLADALPREIARVTAKKERWIVMMAEYPEIAQGMRLSVALMQAEIEAAITAMKMQDIGMMMSSLSALTDYSDED